MNRLLVRIMLAMLVVPIAAMVYFVSIVLFMDAIWGPFAFLWSGVVTALFVAVVGYGFTDLSVTGEGESQGFGRLR